MILETIYVYLPNEGTPVWAPVDAEHVRDDVYRIINCRGEDDEVQFGRGTLVRCRCEKRTEGSGQSTEMLVAYEEVISI